MTGVAEVQSPHVGHVAASILQTIGNTPLVHLRRLSPPGSRLFAKLEGMNPTGSVKDRPALAMIEAAEGRGELEPNHELLEPTSGNTGLSLAMIARVKGYRLTVVAPDNLPEEKLEALRLYGAKIVYSPGERGSNGAIDVARDVDIAGLEYWMLNQYSNAANWQAHFDTTGPEILRDLPDVTAFVAGLGSGGTLMGVSRRLKEHDPNIEVIGAEPMAGDKVQGLRSLGDGFIPPIFEASRLDGRYLIDGAEAVAMTRRLLEEEGIFAGPSSGAAVTAAIRYAELRPGGKIVVLLADGGWKYLSTGVFDAKSTDKALEGSMLW
ncbi:MAG TPA: cysteine synthase family protein [Chloroflexota bacterium]|jgi:cysteine synthase B|nr:cysteine synthase family protein [Chloroflexota bacterium]